MADIKLLLCYRFSCHYWRIINLFTHNKQHKLCRIEHTRTNSSDRLDPLKGRDVNGLHLAIQV